MQPKKDLAAKAWLYKVSRDILSAKALLKSDEPVPESVLFFAQQIAEKSLKGFLTWHGTPFGKSHDLKQLGEAAIQIDKTLKEMAEQTITLTPFAVLFRYPGEDELPTVAEARSSLNLAVDFFEFILKRLPKDTHP